MSYLKWQSLPQGRMQCQKYFIPLKKSKMVRAVATPVAPSPADSADYRKQLCESYGFRQIAEPLPDNITLKNVIDSLPQKVSETQIYKFNIFLLFCNVRFL